MGRSNTQRTLVVCCIVGLAFAVIWGRFVYLGIIGQDELERLAEQQESRVIEVSGNRGEIIDAGGRTLAVSIEQSDVYAVPAWAAGSTETVAALRRAGLSKAEIATITSSDSQFRYVRRGVSPFAGDTMFDQLGGIGTTQTTGRVYPYGTLTAAVVGFTGVDGYGLVGIESQYDERLRPGTTEMVSRMVGYSEWSGPTAQEIRRLSGQPVVLALSVSKELTDLQDLETAVTETASNGGLGIVVDTSNGEIVSCVESPSFSPALYRQIGAEGLTSRLQAAYYQVIPWVDAESRQPAAGLVAQRMQLVSAPAEHFVDYTCLNWDVAFGNPSSTRIHKFRPKSSADAVYSSPLRLACGLVHSLTGGRVSTLRFAKSDSVPKGTSNLPAGSLTGTGTRYFLGAEGAPVPASYSACWRSEGERAYVAIAFLDGPDSTQAAARVANRLLERYLNEQ